MGPTSQLPFICNKIICKSRLWLR